MNDNALSQPRAAAAPCRASPSAWSPTAWLPKAPWWTPSPPRRSAASRSSVTWSSTTWPTPARSRSPHPRSSAPRCSTSTPSSRTWKRSASSAKRLLRKHRVLPLVKRGKKLFIGISDPTNLHALDEVKFATGFSIEAIVVEEDKLDQLLTRSLEQVDTSMPELASEDFEMDSLDVSAGDDEVNRRGCRSVGRRRCPDRPVRQQGDARRHPARRIGHPFRAVRAFVPDPVPSRRRAERSRRPAGPARHQDGSPAEGHVPARHRRAARPPGRPHQDEDLEEPGDRFSRQHVPDALRRKGRDAYPRLVERDAWHRLARLRALPEGSSTSTPWRVRTA